MHVGRFELFADEKFITDRLDARRRIIRDLSLDYARFTNARYVQTRYVLFRPVYVPIRMFDSSEWRTNGRMNERTTFWRSLYRIYTGTFKMNISTRRCTPPVGF